LFSRHLLGGKSGREAFQGFASLKDLGCFFNAQGAYLRPTVGLNLDQSIEL
jgi:hypothetical protein